MELTLFAALHVPTEQAHQLADVAERASERVPGSRVVAAEAMHVTFAYVGAVAEEHVPAIAASLEDAAFSMPGAVALTLTGLDLFGDGHVLGACVDADLHVILDVARDRFQDAVRPFAPRADAGAWRPHVSLLRAPRGGELPRSLRFERLDVQPSTWIAPELRLYASLPGPDGRQHRRMHAVPFGQPVPEA
ncbi:MAG: 2-5 ligase superfamily [Thermoleophilia bacterium]|nr:2-5 ligase superfamily [Thermoleophilia bacterium]